MWKEHHDQYDLRYRLLSLLLHLADSPVNTVYEPPVHSEEEKEAQVKKSSRTACTVMFDSIGGLVCSAKGRRGGAGTLG